MPSPVQYEWPVAALAGEKARMERNAAANKWRISDSLINAVSLAQVRQVKAGNFRSAKPCDKIDFVERRRFAAWCADDQRRHPGPERTSHAAALLRQPDRRDGARAGERGGG